MQETKFWAEGRVFIGFEIHALTGLHIGGKGGGIQIGGVDKEIVRDPLTDRPYIPGSSLKGKIRCLLEKHYQLPINRKIANTWIHSCKDPDEYKNCPVCRVFGIPAEEKFGTQTRLLVRDIILSDESAQLLEGLSLDRSYAELKTEVSIDRVTSAANPRTVERVPAGAIFKPGEMVYTIFNSDDGRADPSQDIEHLSVVFEGMQLLEHDYLGGLGSRGSGRVAFRKISISLRKRTDYFQKNHPIEEFEDLAELFTKKGEVIEKIKGLLGIRG
ncbi:type III-A CRISPR-associated RAMP protein Csm3 [Candidatus Bipolaricaulota sp. J31]